MLCDRDRWKLVALLFHQKVVANNSNVVLDEENREFIKL